MNKLFSLTACVLCGAVSSTGWAETPVTNPMPDGSRDMYVGLGVQSAPRYDGTGSRKVSALPVLQVQWSNGIFISGMSAGMHLSADPTFEYGPLLAVLPGRDDSGSGAVVDGIGANFVNTVSEQAFKSRVTGLQRLTGMDEIGMRLQAGAFANYYVSPAWRLTGSVLYGAGNDHNGARVELGVQTLAAAWGEHHHVSLSAGIGAVNRNFNATYFGVSAQESRRSRFSYYAAAGGLQDVHVGLRWNWALSPSWMLTTNLQAKRLLGSAAHSPLVERPANATVSTAIGYRF